MSLYERNFYAWTQEQAALLKAGNLNQMDVGHVIEELEIMGGRERRELRNRLEELLMHLLKWQYQPNFRGNNWRLSIMKQRRGIEQLFKDSPSLRPKCIEIFEEAYHDVCLDAAQQTGFAIAVFLQTCPWTMEQILHEDFWPED